MGVFEAIVVFVIAWWLVLLPTLSMGGRSQRETGEVVPGSEPGAPSEFPLARKVLVATAGAGILTFAVWLVLRMGWLNGLIGL